MSTSDTIYYGAMAIAIAYMVFIVRLEPATPGRPWSWRRCCRWSADVLGVVYALFASVYPRSGGEYVFLSRVVHPAVGFVVSFIQSRSGTRSTSA